MNFTILGSNFTDATIFSVYIDYLDNAVPDRSFSNFLPNSNNNKQKFDISYNQVGSISLDTLSCKSCTFYIGLATPIGVPGNHSFTLTASSGLAITPLIDNVQVLSRVFPSSLLISVV